jgi:hypothetical protein
MNKAQARQLATGLSLFLVILIALTIRVATIYGLGSKQRELSVIEADDIFKKLFSAGNIDNLTLLHSYEILDKTHKNKFLHFLISFENNADLPIHLGLSSQPISFEVINTIFYANPTPEWWQPANVRRGFYYTGTYGNLVCDVIIDSESKHYYLLVKESKSRKF